MPPDAATGARPTLAQAPTALRAALHLTPADELRPLRTETDAHGETHVRYQQWFKGVPVEHGVVTAHLRAGALETVSGDVIRPAASLSPQPTLTAAAARAKALAAMGGTHYRWQDPAEEALLRRQTNDSRASYFPKGELVVVSDFRQPEAARPAVLAWKFNVYETAPVVRRDLIYVDARSGQVVLRDPIIKHVSAPATMATRYLGARTATTEAFGGGFKLRDLTRSRGVVTMNCQTRQDFATATDFVDNNNDWTAAEYNNAAFDNAALDAHIGAQATQDYWVSQHNRDSYDGRGTVLLSYVHFGTRFENAFWDGTQMVYGDGATRFRPLTSVDICAHEVGHAVCETTANLIYQNESGALNEALSDCWGASIEFAVDSTKQIWLIGEDVDRQRPSLRSMSNPNAEQQPDTYLGTNWYTGTGDNGGVHINSGVLNFWYYLLSVGGGGFNDFNTPYLVPRIGIRKAGQILFRAERLYLTPSTNYPGARQATLQAAADLYGFGSPEVEAVAKAWRAVGLGDANAPVATLTPVSGPIGTVVTISGQGLGTTYRVTFNGTLARTITMPSAAVLLVTVPPGATTGPVVVTTATGTVTAGTFTVTGTGPAPDVLSYTPAGGAPQGAAVTITGTGFTGATAVKFNGTTATFTVVSATQITTTVPATAISGALTVTTPGGTAAAPTPFRVLPAVLTVAPTSGAVGTAVVLSGTSLSRTQTVRFTGGAYATFTATSDTRLTLTVPPGALTGPITVRTPDGEATSPVFTVAATLSLTEFTPLSGPVLTTIVTIRGLGFTGTTAVRFNGTLATAVTVASDQEVWATVPAGATTGPISLTTPLGTVTTTRAFSVTGTGLPQILTLTPTYGLVGAAVTIDGTNLTGATAVRFNGTLATILTNTATTLTTTVPVGATTGQVTVTTALGTAASPTDFRVVEVPANDRCTAANLPVLTCGASLNGSILGATTTGDPAIGPACGTSVDGAGVFYRFVGTGDVVRIATCGGLTNYDSKIHVFTGTCGALNCVTGNDDDCARAAAVTFPSIAGTAYLIFVSGWETEVGDFTLSATCAAPVPPPAITGFSPTSGPVGTLVTITGTGLKNAGTIRFGSITALAVAENTAGTELTVLVPNNARYGQIRVTTTLGSALSTGYFCPQYVARAVDGSRCGPGTVALSVTGSPAVVGTYAWYDAPTGGTPISGTTTGTFTTPALTATTTYYAAVSLNTACVSERVAVTATVRPGLTTPTVTAAPQVNGATLLTSSAATGNQWLLNGTPISGATDATYLATQSGVYTVIVNDGPACASAPSAPQTVTIVTGLMADAAANTLTLAPNPARTTVRVGLPAGSPATLLTLLDVTGRTVRAVAVTGGTTEATLDLRGLPAGVYTVRHGAGRQRLVVE